MVATASRRAALAGLGAAAAAGTLVGALAGCETYGTKSPTPKRTGQVTLGTTAEIPVGGGKIFADQKVVVTQPTNGAFKCFTAICTHMGCLVGSVSGGTINCPCHGSKYSISNGSVVNPPAPRPLAAESITVSGENIVLNG